MMPTPVNQRAGLPPEQAALRDRSLPADNQWHDFTPEEVNQTIPERLAHIIARYPQRMAVKDPVRAFTYAELDVAANQVAQAVLRTAGTGREPVPYLFHVDARRTPAVHGILRAGKPAVPIDAVDAPDRLTWLIKDTGARAIVTGCDTVELAESVAPKHCPVIDLDAIAATECAEPVHVTCEPRDIAMILYTSGSTGRPKGALNSHRSMLARLRGHIVYDFCAPGERLTTVGLRLGDIGYPLTGATYCPFPIRQEGLHSFAAWLQQEEITRILTIATGFRQLLDIVKPGQTFPEVRSIRVTSEPLTNADIAAARESFPVAVLLNTLSLSEAGWVANHYIDPHAPAQEEPLPVGYIVDDKEVWLEDEAGNRMPAGNRVPHGEAGEIVICGKDLALGYWNRPELTAERFRDDPRGDGRRIYATGDVGRFRADGALVHLGRKDLQLKIRGHRVEIGEVEAALRAWDAVKDVAVRDWTDDNGERYLAAYVVPGQPEVSALSLRQHATGRLPEYMAPRAYVLVEALPRLYNGKVDRRSLPEPARVRPHLATTYAAPATPLEARLAEIWAEVLDLDQVGVDDRFTDLGGHSLAAVRLLAALDEFTEQELPFAVLLEAGTVRELARVLEDGAWAPQWKSLVQVQPGDGRPSLFVVPAAASTSLSLGSFAKEIGAEQGVYGFDPLGMDGREAAQESVEEMAAYYIAEMRRFQPEGPYLLGGRCFGALVAVEMARQLELQGASVPLVAVLDSGALQLRTIRSPLERRLVRWEMRRQDHSPLELIQQSVRYRTRKAYKRLRSPARVVSQEHKPTSPVRDAHRRASARYQAQRIRSRLVVYLSQEYVARGFNRDWRAIAAGDYVEEVCDRWSHAGFLADAETLRHVCDHLRDELRRLPQGALIEER